MEAMASSFEAMGILPPQAHAYAADFILQDLTVELCPDLSDGDLKELGVSLGHRLRMRRAWNTGETPSTLSKYDRVQLATEYIRSKTSTRPTVALVLGTGLGMLADEVTDAVRLPYVDIPGFPACSAQAHAGELLVGHFRGVPVVVMRGRIHYYEGVEASDLTFPIYVLRSLGATTLLISNACGGLNPDLTPGDIVLLRSHVNLMGVTPLRGVNDDRLGPRWPHLRTPYSDEVGTVAEDVATGLGTPLRTGIYIATPGPECATHAELQLWKGMGGDVYGMSTVPEVIAAKHAGFPHVVVFSVVTDMVVPWVSGDTPADDCIAAAKAAGPKLAAIVAGLLERLPAAP